MPADPLDAPSSSAAPTAATGMPAARIAIFVAVMTSFSTLLHVYVASSLAPNLPAPWSTVASIVVWSGAVLMPLGLGLWRFVGRDRARWVTRVGLTWGGALAYLFLGFLAVDLVRLFLPAASSLSLVRAAAIAVPIAALALTVYGLAVVARGPTLTRVEVPVAGLPAALVGLRVAHLSDVHIGPTVERDFIERLVARVNDLAPDLVAVTGDLVDGPVAELAPDAAPLARLRAPLGTFFVTGNHEYYSGHEAWLAHLPTLGLRPLRNTRVRVERGGEALDLAGVPDVQGASFGDPPDLDAALAGRRDDDPTPLVVLAHRPAQATRAAARGAALVLAGHTHGGQLWPFHVFAKRGQPSIRGLHPLDSAAAPGRRTWLFTSMGTGYWGPPMRVGTRSEIVLLTLVPA